MNCSLFDKTNNYPSPYIVKETTITEINFCSGSNFFQLGKREQSSYESIDSARAVQRCEAAVQGQA